MKLDNKSYKKRIKVNKMRIFEIVVIICLLGSIFESGYIMAQKKYKKDYDNLYSNYKELFDEYKDYKEHSWILLG